MKRPRPGRLPLLALLVLVLPLVLGLAPGQDPGARMSAEEARQEAELEPGFVDLISKPTVETTAEYSSATDIWRVTLTEQVSNETVGYLRVNDDTGETREVWVSPGAEELTYPDLSEDEATKLAGASPRVQEELSEHDAYTTEAGFNDGEWTVHYYVDDGVDDGELEVARVGVADDTWALNYVWTGDQVGWQMARGETGAYGKEANYPYVWGPLALIFALAFVRTDKLFSLRNLDVLMLLGFLLSHAFFRQGIVYEAVLLWHPPLIYLLLRSLLLGFGIGERVEKTSNFPTWLLLALALIASGLTIGLNMDSRVLDVGYAGVIGADLILEGTVPYGNMPEDNGAGDTYGPLNYLLYVPAVLIWGFSGQWDFLPAAHAVTIASFVVGAAALLFAGWRFAGPRAGAAMLFAWAVFPYTLYAANNNTNDLLVAAVAAVGLALATSPLARGITITAGFAIKLYPFLLIPLWLLHDGPRKKPVLKFVTGGAVVVLLSFWVLFIDGDPVESVRLFYERTVAFQGSREAPWNIFAQIPQIAFLKSPLMAAAVLLAFLIPAFSRKRTVRRLAASSAAIVIFFQLTANYWFYPYITWFQPYLFLALLLATNEKTPLDGSDDEEPITNSPEPHGTPPATR